MPGVPSPVTSPTEDVALGSSLGGPCPQGSWLPGSHRPAPAGCPSRGRGRPADPGKVPGKAGGSGTGRTWGNTAGKRRGDLGRGGAQRPLRRVTGTRWTFAEQAPPCFIFGQSAFVKDFIQFSLGVGGYLSFNFSTSNEGCYSRPRFSPRERSEAPCRNKNKSQAE